MIRPAIVGYVPRSDINPKICSPSAFVENISKFKTRFPLCLYTDGLWKIAELTIGNPEKGPNLEAKLKNGWPNSFVLNNFIFATGLRIALRRGFTHIIYLEADCRVGRDYWDQELFEFHFKSPQPLVCSGTAVAFNVCTAGREAHLRWRQWVSEQKHIPGYEGLTAAVYGWRGQKPTNDQPIPERPTVFVNGALGCYDVRWLAKLFGFDGLPPEKTKDNCRVWAENNFAWDFNLGYRLWQEFGIHVFDLVQNNPGIYSGFGEIMSSESERMQMLKDGIVTAVHQVKSNAL